MSHDLHGNNPSSNIGDGSAEDQRLFALSGGRSASTQPPPGGMGVSFPGQHTGLTPQSMVSSSQVFDGTSGAFRAPGFQNTTITRLPQNNPLQVDTSLIRPHSVMSSHGASGLTLSGIQGPSSSLGFSGTTPNHSGMYSNLFKPFNPELTSPNTIQQLDPTVASLPPSIRNAATPAPAPVLQQNQAVLQHSALGFRPGEVVETGQGTSIIRETSEPTPQPVQPAQPIRPKATYASVVREGKPTSFSSSSAIDQSTYNYLAAAQQSQLQKNQFLQQSLAAQNTAVQQAAPQTQEEKARQLQTLFAAQKMQQVAQNQINFGSRQPYRDTPAFQLNATEDLRPPPYVTHSTRGRPPGRGQGKTRGWGRGIQIPANSVTSVNDHVRLQHHAQTIARQKAEARSRGLQNRQALKGPDEETLDRARQNQAIQLQNQQMRMQFNPQQTLHLNQQQMLASSSDLSQAQHNQMTNAMSALNMFHNNQALQQQQQRHAQQAAAQNNFAQNLFHSVNPLTFNPTTTTPPRNKPHILNRERPPQTAEFVARKEYLLDDPGAVKVPFPQPSSSSGPMEPLYPQPVPSVIPQLSNTPGPSTSQVAPPPDTPRKRSRKQTFETDEPFESVVSVKPSYMTHLEMQMRFNNPPPVVEKKKRGRPRNDEKLANQRRMAEMMENQKKFEASSSSAFVPSAIGDLTLSSSHKKVTPAMIYQESQAEMLLGRGLAEKGEQQDRHLAALPKGFQNALLNNMKKQGDGTEVKEKKPRKQYTYKDRPNKWQIRAAQEAEALKKQQEEEALRQQQTSSQQPGTSRSEIAWTDESGPLVPTMITNTPSTSQPKPAKTPIVTAAARKAMVTPPKPRQPTVIQKAEAAREKSYSPAKRVPSAAPAPKPVERAPSPITRPVSRPVSRPISSRGRKRNNETIVQEQPSTVASSSTIEVVTIIDTPEKTSTPRPISTRPKSSAGRASAAPAPTVNAPTEEVVNVDPEIPVFQRPVTAVTRVPYVARPNGPLLKGSLRDRDCPEKIRNIAKASGRTLPELNPIPKKKKAKKDKKKKKVAVGIVQKKKEKQASAKKKKVKNPKQKKQKAEAQKKGILKKKSISAEAKKLQRFEELKKQLSKPPRTQRERRSRFKFLTATLKGKNKIFDRIMERAAERHKKKQEETLKKRQIAGKSSKSAEQNNQQDDVENDPYFAKMHALLFQRQETALVRASQTTITFKKIVINGHVMYKRILKRPQDKWLAHEYTARKARQAAAFLRSQERKRLLRQKKLEVKNAKKSRKIVVEGPKTIRDLAVKGMQRLYRRKNMICGICQKILKLENIIKRIRDENCAQLRKHDPFTLNKVKNPINVEVMYANEELFLKVSRAEKLRDHYVELLHEKTQIKTLAKRRVADAIQKCVSKLKNAVDDPRPEKEAVEKMEEEVEKLLYDKCMRMKPFVLGKTPSTKVARRRHKLRRKIQLERKIATEAKRLRDSKRRHQKRDKYDDNDSDDEEDRRAAERRRKKMQEKLREKRIHRILNGRMRKTTMMIKRVAKAERRRKKRIAAARAEKRKKMAAAKKLTPEAAEKRKLARTEEIRNYWDNLDMKYKWGVYEKSQEELKFFMKKPAQTWQRILFDAIPKGVQNSEEIKRRESELMEEFKKEKLKEEQIVENMMKKIGQQPKKVETKHEIPSGTLQPRIEQPKKKMTLWDKSKPDDEEEPRGPEDHPAKDGRVFHFIGGKLYETVQYDNKFYEKLYEENEIQKGIVDRREKMDMDVAVEVMKRGFARRHAQVEFTRVVNEPRLHLMKREMLRDRQLQLNSLVNDNDIFEMYKYFKPIDRQQLTYDEIDEHERDIVEFLINKENGHTVSLDEAKKHEELIKLIAHDKVFSRNEEQLHMEWREKKKEAERKSRKEYNVPHPTNIAVDEKEVEKEIDICRQRYQLIALEFCAHDSEQVYRKCMERRKKCEEIIAALEKHGLVEYADLGAITSEKDENGRPKCLAPMKINNNLIEPVTLCYTPEALIRVYRDYVMGVYDTIEEDVREAIISKDLDRFYDKNEKELRQFEAEVRDLELGEHKSPNHKKIEILADCFVKSKWLDWKAGTGAEFEEATKKFKSLDKQVATMNENLRKEKLKARKEAEKLKQIAKSRRPADVYKRNVQLTNLIATLKTQVDVYKDAISQLVNGPPVDMNERPTVRSWRQFQDEDTSTVHARFIVPIISRIDILDRAIVIALEKVDAERVSELENMTAERMALAKRVNAFEKENGSVHTMAYKFFSLIPANPVESRALKMDEGLKNDEKMMMEILPRTPDFTQGIGYLNRGMVDRFFARVGLLDENVENVEEGDQNVEEEGENDANEPVTRSKSADRKNEKNGKDNGVKTRSKSADVKTVEDPKNKKKEADAKEADAKEKRGVPKKLTASEIKERADDELRQDLERKALSVLGLTEKPPLKTPEEAVKRSLALQNELQQRISGLKKNEDIPKGLLKVEIPIINQLMSINMLQQRGRYSWRKGMLLRKIVSRKQREAQAVRMARFKKVRQDRAYLRPILVAKIRQLEDQLEAGMETEFACYKWLEKILQWFDPQKYLDLAEECYDAYDENLSITQNRTKKVRIFRKWILSHAEAAGPENPFELDDGVTWMPTERQMNATLLGRSPYWDKKIPLPKPAQAEKPENKDPWANDGGLRRLIDCNIIGSTQATRNFLNEKKFRYVEPDSEKLHRFNQRIRCLKNIDFTQLADELEEKISKAHEEMLVGEKKRKRTTSKRPVQFLIEADSMKPSRESWHGPGYYNNVGLPIEILSGNMPLTEEAKKLLHKPKELLATYFVHLRRRLEAIFKIKSILNAVNIKADRLDEREEKGWTCQEDDDAFDIEEDPELIIPRHLYDRFIKPVEPINKALSANGNEKFNVLITKKFYAKLLKKYETEEAVKMALQKCARRSKRTKEIWIPRKLLSEKMQAKVKKFEAKNEKDRLAGKKSTKLNKSKKESKSKKNEKSKKVVATKEKKTPNNESNLPKNNKRKLESGGKNVSGKPADDSGEPKTLKKAKTDKYELDKRSKAYADQQRFIEERWDDEPCTSATSDLLQMVADASYADEEQDVVKTREEKKVNVQEGRKKKKEKIMEIPLSKEELAKRRMVSVAAKILIEEGINMDADNENKDPKEPKGLKARTLYRLEKETAVKTENAENTASENATKPEKKKKRRKVSNQKEEMIEFELEYTRRPRKPIVVEKAKETAQEANTWASILAGMNVEVVNKEETGSKKRDKSMSKKPEVDSVQQHELKISKVEQEEDALVRKILEASSIPEKSKKQKTIKGDQKKKGSLVKTKAKKMKLSNKKQEAESSSKSEKMTEKSGDGKTLKISKVKKGTVKAGSKVKKLTSKKEDAEKKKKKVSKPDAKVVATESDVKVEESTAIENTEGLEAVNVTKKLKQVENPEISTETKRAESLTTSEAVPVKSDENTSSESKSESKKVADDVVIATEVKKTVVVQEPVKEIVSKKPEPVHIEKDPFIESEDNESTESSEHDFVVRPTAQDEVERTTPVEAQEEKTLKDVTQEESKEHKNTKVGEKRKISTVETDDAKKPKKNEKEVPAKDSTSLRKEETKEEETKNVKELKELSIDVEEVKPKSKAGRKPKKIVEIVLDDEEEEKVKPSKKGRKRAKETTDEDASDDPDYEFPDSPPARRVKVETSSSESSDDEEEVAPPPPPAAAPKPRSVGRPPKNPGAVKQTPAEPPVKSSRFGKKRGPYKKRQKPNEPAKSKVSPPLRGIPKYKGPKSAAKDKEVKLELIDETYDPSKPSTSKKVRKNARKSKTSSSESEEDDDDFFGAAAAAAEAAAAAASTSTPGQPAKKRLHPTSDRREAVMMAYALKISKEEEKERLRRMEEEQKNADAVAEEEEEVKKRGRPKK